MGFGLSGNYQIHSHFVAGYLLQLLAAIEACHGFFLHSAYLRTYHNRVADALTRQDANGIFREEGLEAATGVEERLLLDRGWQKRALIWGRQAAADRDQALQLSEHRQRAPPLARILDCQLEVAILDLSDHPRRYRAAFLTRGAGDGEGSDAELAPVVCLSIPPSGVRQKLKVLEETVTSKEVQFVWTDALSEPVASEAQRLLEQRGFECQTKLLCGRTLGDQVWWRRWVCTGTKGSSGEYAWVTADDEPCTPIPPSFPLEWKGEDSKIPPSEWEAGVLKLDSAFPFLGATRPKPAGTLSGGGTRKLVWDPKRPLPGLHPRSWDPKAEDRLLLLGSGPDGPAARTIRKGEAALLLHGRYGHHPDEAGPEDFLLQRTPPLPSVQRTSKPRLPAAVSLATPLRFSCVSRRVFFLCL